MHTWRLLITSLLLIVLLGGCVTKARLYEGKARPPSEIAIVTMDTSLGVVTVDGVKPFGLNRTMELHLLPGDHTIVIFFNSGGRQSTDNVTLHIEADAGRTYHIAAGAAGGAWRPYIVPVR